MNDYLIDRETLGKFVDELIKNKALPVDSAEELNDLREANIKALDDKIGLAIFGSLTDEQYAEFEQLLDRDDGNPEVYQDFFNSIGLDVQDIITKAMQEFQNEFLGGQNAE